MIRTITFDADETLWDFRGVMRAALAAVEAEMRSLAGPGAPVPDVNTMVRVREEAAEEARPGGSTLREIREEAIRRAMALAGLDGRSTHRQLCDIFWRRRRGLMRPFDDVVPALTGLQAAYTLGIITNGNSRPEDCGIERLFSFVVSADEDGVEKPSPAAFHLAAERAGCPVFELLHVGDSIDTDVEGALGAGANAVWLRRPGLEPPRTPPAVPEIASLAELPEVLDSSSGERVTPRDGLRHNPRQ